MDLTKSLEMFLKRFYIANKTNIFKNLQKYFHEKTLFLVIYLTKFLKNRIGMLFALQ